MSFENWFYFITLIGGPAVCVIAILAIDFVSKISDKKAKKEFDAMVNKGTKAWADVPDATEFVEDLRGND